MAIVGYCKEISTHLPHSILEYLKSHGILNYSVTHKGVATPWLKRTGVTLNTKLVLSLAQGHNIIVSISYLIDGGVTFYFLTPLPHGY